MNHYRVVEHYHHNVTGPEPQQSVNNCHGVLHQTFGFFPHEGVGYQEPPYEEENINCQEGPSHEAEEEFLHNCWDSCNVIVVLQPNRKEMPKYDPKHRYGLDAIEDVEIVMLVCEYFEGLAVVEGLHYLVRYIFFLLLLSHLPLDHREHSHQEEKSQEDNSHVEPARYVILDILRVDLDGPHRHGVADQLLNYGVDVLELIIHDGLDVVACALGGQTKSRVHSG